MQIEVKLKCLDNEMISHDYLYPMASMLKNVLEKVAKDFCAELHSGEHGNKIKMFAFSPLSSSPKPRSVRIEGEKRSRMLLGGRAWFRLASPWPELVNALGGGLLNAGEIRIASKRFKVENLSPSYRSGLETLQNGGPTFESRIKLSFGGG